MNNLSDLSYAFNLSRQCMRILDIWPDPNVPLNVFRRPKIRFILITLIMGLYVFTPQMINVIRAWGNINRMMEFFVAINFFFMALCKLIFTRYHGETLRTLIASIMTDWITSESDWERNTMLKLAKTGRMLSFGYFAAAIGTIITAYYVRLVRVFQNIHQPYRHLVYRFDYIQKSPNYEITCALQMLGSTCAILGNYSADCFISILVLHMCAQLMNLRIKLNNLINDLDSESISSSKFRKNLTAIVMRHKHIIRKSIPFCNKNITKRHLDVIRKYIYEKDSTQIYARYNANFDFFSYIKCSQAINDCYSPVLFVHMLGASFQFCLITFQIFTMLTDNLDFSLIRVLFLTFFTFFVLTQLFVYCYAAERLITESTNMAYGVYECKWYDIPAKNAKDLMLIVYRSINPLKLSAGKFGNFSLELFAMAIKTSLGYLSALLTIRE